ncbi:hypothetical protein EGR_00558 [Echinococcus granulosus]|uniref:Uncharacterized protein n=1 Tax=Echinococcus granulosus TaxID=6210 RepID=W6UTI0_ECHGR|nr:hypothetical protein EGR_00558 [Echinococcus granulosus]EUB64608.1 hypothetical protein EGR_00558 [Echinococcus granulosus]
MSLTPALLTAALPQVLKTSETTMGPTLLYLTDLKELFLTVFAAAHIYGASCPDMDLTIGAQLYHINVILVSIGKDPLWRGYFAHFGGCLALPIVRSSPHV